MSQATLQRKPAIQPRRRRRADIWPAVAVCVFLALAILIVFSRTLVQGFCDVDDYLFVTDEPHVSAGFSWSGIGWALTNGPKGDWYPLSMLSHMLDCQLYGLQPAGHHLTNVLLHAAAAVALFLVLLRMTAGLWPSAVVAALFALHPLHVESVAWISERRDVLSGLFFMLTLGAYDEYSRHPRSIGRYLAVVGLFTLGLLAKPMLVTLPPLLLLLDFWPLGRFHGAQRAAARTPERPMQTAWWLVLEKLPLLALALAAAVMTMLGHATRSLLPVTLAERLAEAVVSCVAYLGQLFVPVGLSVYYPFSEAGRPLWQVVLAALVLLAITAAAVIYRRACPYFFVGWFWYLGMLVPVLGLIPVGDHARADRYTYLSQIGLYLALVWGAMRLVGAWPARRWAFGVGAAIMLAALVACSWRQTGFWQDPRTLWGHALACDPNNIPAHYFFGVALKENDGPAAAAQLRLVLQTKPTGREIYNRTRAQAHNHLADIAYQTGDVAGAIAELEQALETTPTYALAHVKMGIMLADKGDYDRAIDHYTRAIELEPDNAVFYNDRAMALAQQGNTKEAIADLKQALEIDPHSYMAHANLGHLLAEIAELDEAIVQLRRAVDIDPSDFSSCREIARFLRKQGKLSEAVEYDERAVAARRRWVQARNLRGRELAHKGKIDEAIAQFQTVIATAPDDAQAHCNLAEVLARQGETEDALAHYRRALEIDANFAPARQGLDQLSNR